MKITNTKINTAINTLNEKTNRIYQVRTDCDRADLYRSEKYFLYLQVDEFGVHMPGAYGVLVAGYKTQKALIENL